MAHQISVSNQIYADLLMLKGKRSFSEVIKEALTAAKGRIETEESKAASKRLLARMKKGYNLGGMIGTRDDWHAR